jgi:hypothetical protein
VVYELGPSEIFDRAGDSIRACARRTYWLQLKRNEYCISPLRHPSTSEEKDKEGKTKESVEALSLNEACAARR